MRGNLWSFRMIDFEPTEEQRLVRESVADFARSTLAPRVREMERARQVPEDVRRLAHEMGLGLVTVPERAGGQGLGMLTAVLLEEELGAADAAAAFGLAGPGAFGTAVAELGTPEQVEASLAGFADEDGYGRFGAVAWSERAPNKARAGFATTATPVEGGYTITGARRPSSSTPTSRTASSSSRRSTPQRAGAASARSSCVPTTQA